MRTHNVELFADYHQFYLQDEPVGGDLSESWSQEAVERMFAVAPGVVGVGTARNTTVPVQLEFLAQAPPTDLSPFDHVVEGSMVVDSGRIVVAGCTDYFPDAARFDVAPGVYRVRMSAAGLDTLSDNGLDGDDSYLIQLWPAPPVEPTVLKQHLP